MKHFFKCFVVVCLVVASAAIVPSEAFAVGVKCRSDQKPVVVDNVTVDCEAQGEGDPAPPGWKDLSKVSTPSKPRVCKKGGVVVSCVLGDSWWSDSRECYVSPAEETPIAIGQAGPKPGDGYQLYLCNRGVEYKDQDTVIKNNSYHFWSQSSPLSVASLETAARSAVARMNITAPKIGIAPPLLEEKDDSMGIIGLPIWLWAANPGPSTTGPNTLSASAGGTSVTATATLTKTTWDMGDGNSVTCKGKNAAGTVWSEGVYNGNKAKAVSSPTCGYTYMYTSKNEPDMAYTVKVTATWTVNWSGGGQNGFFTIDVERTGHLRIGELKVLITQGG